MRNSTDLDTVLQHLAIMTSFNILFYAQLNECENKFSNDVMS